MRLGLVFDGGGGLGAYEIGVWKALKKLDIDKYVTSISGTSIGALNATLFVQGDMEIAEYVWENIDVEKILPISNVEFIIKATILSLGLKSLSFVKRHVPNILKEGKLSREGLIDIIDKNINLNTLIDSKINCYACCTEIPKIKAKYFRLQDYKEKDIKSILLATSAIPTIFECEKIDSKNYLDGGVVDNTPVYPVYSDGCDIIIVVHLSKIDKVDRRKFPGSQIIEVVPTEIDEGVIDGVLNFVTEAVQKRIKQGYNDTIELLMPIFKIANEQLKEKD